MKKYIPWLFRLIGPTLLAVFLFKSDLNLLFTTLRGADWWPITLSLLLLPPFLIIKTWRWQQILHELKLELDLITGSLLYAVGIYWGSVTPGQAGDLVRAWYLRDRGQPLAPALFSVMLDRLFDLLVMAVLATIGIFALGQLLPSRELQTLLVLTMGTGLAFVTIGLAMRKPRKWLLTQGLPKILPKHLWESLNNLNAQLATLNLHPRLIFAVTAASLLSAMFTFYRLWLLFVALKVFIPLFIVIGVSALIAILQVLPISIAGVGVRDAALIAVLLNYGYAPEQALSVSALFLLLTLEHILVGFIISFWFPLGKMQLQNEVNEE